jgi:hypothetical protein
MAQAQTTESGGRLPQPTEEVHLPDPSYLPVLLAVSVWVALVGVTISWIMTGVGAVVFLVVLFRWIGQARREMRELPLEH